MFSHTFCALFPFHCCHLIPGCLLLPSPLITVHLPAPHFPVTLPASITFACVLLDSTLSQRVKLMVTNSAVSGKWLDPNSSRNVIFSRCSVNQGWRNLLRHGWLCMKVWACVCDCCPTSPCFTGVGEWRVTWQTGRKVKPFSGKKYKM